MENKLVFHFYKLKEKRSIQYLKYYINVFISLSKLIPMQFEDIYKRCALLQSKLKDQYLLLTTQQDQKTTLEKKLTTSLKNYYRNLIQLDFNLNKDMSGTKILLEDEGFGNCYIFIKETILGFAKNPDLCLAAIKKHSSWQKTHNFIGVVRIIITSMYENVVDDELTHKDILYFMKGVIKMIVESKQKISEYNFEEPGLVYDIFREFTKKSDYISYAMQVVRSTLLELAKLDKLIDFKSVDEEGIKSVKQVSSKRFDSPTKQRQPSTSFSSFSDKIIYTKSQAYSEALRKKDSKIRTTTSIRTKNKHCVSSDLMQFLGINDNICIPSFTCCNKQEEIREEEQVNNQWSLILNKKDSNTGKNISGADIILLKNLVFIFFSDLFKMLYSMPATMRIICNILYEELMKKYKDRKDCLNVVGNFVIGYWVMSALKINEELIQSNKVSDYTNQNALTVKKVVFGIIHNDFKDIDKSFQNQFSFILSNLRISIFNYLSELIKIQVPKFETVSQITQIKSYSVCLSVADVSHFLKMISQSAQEINPINDKIMKKVERIYQMSEGTDIFGPRKDKGTNKQYKDHESYVLFSDLVLPKQLSFDYAKFYNDAFKKDKAKNLLRQVLLNISDIQQFNQFPSYCSNLRQFFTYILKTRKQNYNLNSLDRIPAQLKINYLISMTKTINLEDLIEPMLKQVQERLDFMQNVWDKSKECYLKAISSVIRQNQKISYNEINYKEEQKKKKIQEFMKTAKINACLTSAKTREKQIVLKTNVIKEISQQDKQKIWLDNQSKCIHSALNLQFIKSLTGEGEKTKTKYESHITNPIKFAQIFCSLPEVKEKGMSGEDTIGMKDALSHFLNFCIDVIKANPQYSILTEDLAWLQQNLQQRISKRIYDKLYPKTPTYDDLGLYFRLKTLDWVNYQHLKIDPFMRVDGIWDVAAKHLKRIDKMKTASEKLTCIVECSKMLIKSYSLVGVNEGPVSAEDIYPIVINVVIKAAPRRLISNINFIDMFTNPNRLMSEDGYFFTQLKSAIKYCDCLKHDNLGMEMVDFNKQIYKKEIEYGIYFLLTRRKDSPRTANRKIEYLKKYCRKKKDQQNQPPIQQKLKTTE